MLLSVLLFVLSFVLLWFGSGVVVGTITKVAKQLKISSFFISFFVLGFFTSITEIMVGVNAYINNEPEIFVGNLVGGSVVLFLLVVPVLAVIGNGVKLNHEFDIKDLIAAAIVVGLPALLTLDDSITVIDALVCIVVYGYLIVSQERKNGSIRKLVFIDIRRNTVYLSLVKIIGAMALVFVASNILVDQIHAVGQLVGMSPYILSMLIVSLGTNIPEMSIAGRAILSKHKEIAFGDYVGSATLNTLELGLLSLLGGRAIPATGSNYSVLLFIAGLVLFVLFGKSKRLISRNEGVLLLGLYVSFVICELFTGPGWRL